MIGGSKLSLQDQIGPVCCDSSCFGAATAWAMRMKKPTGAACGQLGTRTTTLFAINSTSSFRKHTYRGPTPMNGATHTSRDPPEGAPVAVHCRTPERKCGGLHTIRSMGVSHPQAIGAKEFASSCLIDGSGTLGRAPLVRDINISDRDWGGGNTDERGPCFQRLVLALPT